MKKKEEDGQLEHDKAAVDALNSVIDAIMPLDEFSRKRVLMAAAVFFEIDLEQCDAR